MGLDLMGLDLMHQGTCTRGHTIYRAIFIQDAQLFLAVSRYFSAKRGIDYRQVALIAMDYDPRFEWCDPPVAHFRWDEQAVVRRVVRWVDRVAQGKQDLRQYITPAQFIGGETLPRVGGV